MRDERNASGVPKWNSWQVGKKRDPKAPLPHMRRGPGDYFVAASYISAT
jgi:hypothetical protein